MNPDNGERPSGTPPERPSKHNRLSIFRLVVDDEQDEHAKPVAPPTPFELKKRRAPDPPVPAPAPVTATQPQTGVPASETATATAEHTSVSTSPNQKTWRYLYIVVAVLIVAVGLGIAEQVVRHKAAPQESSTTAPIPQQSAPVAQRPGDDPAALASSALAGFAIGSPQADAVRKQAEAVAIGAVDATKSASFPFNGYLYDLPRDRRFAAAWNRALNTIPPRVRSANAWLVRLEASSAPNRVIDTPEGGRYVVAWGCDPQACSARRVHVVYDVRDGTLAAATHVRSGWYNFGSNSAAARAVLLAELTREALGLSGTSTRGDEAGSAVRAFVAAVPG